MGIRIIYLPTLSKNSTYAHNVVMVNLADVPGHTLVSAKRYVHKFLDLPSVDISPRVNIQGNIVYVADNFLISETKQPGLYETRIIVTDGTETDEVRFVQEITP